ncbi:MAG: hypothetical protein QG611_1406 [Bacteroidota bacterium]|nr:hypothetical protein [Bacteroidota bacterium]
MKKNIFYLIVVFIAIFSGCSVKDDIKPADEGKIIILLYHRISNGEASNIYERSVIDFEADLMYLIYNNINIISFNDLNTIKESGKMPAGHSAIISFDDGDCTWFTSAIPLLKKYRMKATFFLWTEMIGRNSFIKQAEIEYMSNYMLPDGVRPFSFGSHTYSHQYLFQRKAGFSSIDEYNLFLDYELGKSKSLIETYIYEDVTGLALPFGDGAGDPEIIAAAKRNGYRFIRTSINGIIGSADIDLLNLPSLPMLDKTDQEEIGYYLNN